MSCADCKHWKLRREHETGHAQGLGECQAVPMMWDMTEWRDDADERVFKAEAAQFTAFAQDGSDYRAYLLTKPEHGCTMFAARGVTASGEAQQPGETYLAYLARCEHEGRNTKPQAKDQGLCREPGCSNSTKTPVSAWCREHDRAGGFPHA